MKNPRVFLKLTKPPPRPPSGKKFFMLNSFNLKYVNLKKAGVRGAQPPEKKLAAGGKIFHFWHGEEKGQVIFPEQLDLQFNYVNCYNFSKAPGAKSWASPEQLNLPFNHSNCYNFSKAPGAKSWA
jgi:hypothetical protein